MESIKAGLLGFGTVGGGTFGVLYRNQQEIKRRAGRGIEITRIAVRRVAQTRDAVSAILATNGGLDAQVSAQGSAQVANALPLIDSDFDALVADPKIDIVVETIGGTDRARELVLAAIANGKHVVTANKALLAIHGTEIFQAAHAKGVMVAFEAAVAGGIPIIKALREGLSGNRIEWIAGIINGTTNFILSEMRDRGVDFATALADAQRLGYAEADPTFDIEGVDAAHKLTLMSAIAFGVPIQFDRAYVEGISKLDAVDIQYAEELGYRIKLLGITRRVASGIELRVHPTLIPAKRLLANVEGAMNAVAVQADAVGTTLYYGKGAGAEPTASAVVADMVDVTRLHTADPEHRTPHLAFQPDQLSDTPILPIDAITSAYYLRLRVADVTGVLASIATTLAEHGISVGAVLQKESREGVSETDLVVLTHATTEGNLRTAIGQIEALNTVVAPVTLLRTENL